MWLGQELDLPPNESGAKIHKASVPSCLAVRVGDCYFSAVREGYLQGASSVCQLFIPETEGPYDFD